MVKNILAQHFRNGHTAAIGLYCLLIIVDRYQYLKASASDSKV